MILKGVASGDVSALLASIGYNMNVKCIWKPLEANCLENTLTILKKGEKTFLGK